MSALRPYAALEIIAPLPPVVQQIIALGRDGSIRPGGLIDRMWKRAIEQRLAWLELAKAVEDAEAFVESLVEYDEAASDALEDEVTRLDRVYSDEVILMRKWGMGRTISVLQEQVDYQRERITALESERERLTWTDEDYIEQRTRFNARLNTALNLMFEHEDYNPFLNA